MQLSGQARTRNVDTGLSRYRAVLSKPNFALLWGGQTISWFGDSLYFLSLLWLVQEMTGSRAMMGVVAACRTIPSLMGFLVGALVDRLDKRRLMLAVSMCQALTVASVPLLKAVGLLRTWHIPVIAFLLAILGIFFVPARQTLIPYLVKKDELVHANSLMTLSQQAIFIAGYGTGGLLIASLGVMPLFWIDAVSFLGVIAAIWLLRVPGLQRPDSAEQTAAGAFGRAKALRAEVMAGLEFMMKTPAISLVMPLSILFNFLFAPFSVLLPSWVKDVLNRGPEVFGFIQTATMAGMVLGSLAVGLLVHKVRMSWALPVSLIVMALSIIGFAATRQVWLALLFTGIMGTANAFTNVVFNSYIQAVVPREMMGRVWGTLGTIGQVAAPAGQALAGFLGQVVALPVLFGVEGWATTIISVSYCLAPRIREVFDSVEKSIVRGSEAD